VGKCNDLQLLGLGLIDKADVQNERQPGLPTKNISCMEPHTTWDYPRITVLTEPMQANMVFTCGAGIYTEGFGIRLEDDVNTETGALQLLRNIEVEEIESLMNK
jgi:Xaa-Pro aminopeptidase